MAARLVQELPANKLPSSPEWIYELKLDGYRALLLKNDSRVELRSRNDHGLNGAYSAIVAAGHRIGARQVTLDGEIVALDQHGRPSFQALQDRKSFPDHRVVFVVFDLLHLNGEDYTTKTLDERRQALAALIDEVDDVAIRLSIELMGTPAGIVRAVTSAELEGVIAKRKASVYSPGRRTDDWQKFKIVNSQEFVIGGIGLTRGDLIRWLSDTTRVDVSSLQPRCERASCRMRGGNYSRS